MGLPNVLARVEQPTPPAQAQLQTLLNDQVVVA